MQEKETVVNNELQIFQQKVQRCAQTCNDKAQSFLESDGIGEWIKRRGKRWMHRRVREGLREGVKADSEEGGRVVDDVVVVVYSIYS